MGKLMILLNNSIEYKFSGYCFSASLPPLLSVAAINALDRIDKHPEMLEALRNCCSRLHNRIFKSELSKFFVLGSNETSPLKHLYLIDELDLLSVQQNILNNIVNYVSIYLSFSNNDLNFSLHKIHYILFSHYLCMYLVF